MKLELIDAALREVIRARVREGKLYEQRPDGKLLCYACGHRCLIPEGRAGVCRVRYNEGGRLLVPWGYVGALQLDPIEKKPFFHAYPGSRALSFGMLGCDLHCAYCQNWITSQALRDPGAVAPISGAQPEALADLAVRHGARVVTSTYNEPLITSEWAVAVFKAALQRGLVCSFVSNGNATPEVLDYLQPYVRLYKVDLKSFDDRHYRQLGGRLEPILESIRGLAARGFWVEIVTPIVPGFNDSDAELREMACFLGSVSVDIPWHVTAFHSDYKMTETRDTPVSTLLRAYDLGREAGLRYVYPGNAPGHVGDRESTFCPSCDRRLIERRGFRVLANHLRDGRCPHCAAAIPGVWA